MFTYEENLGYSQDRLVLLYLGLAKLSIQLRAANRRGGAVG